MASTKTFADMKKPVRQPTPEQIAAFEETGKASRALDPALLATETRNPVSPELNPSGDATLREPGNPGSQKPAKPQTRKSASTDHRKHADTETRISAKPEIQEHGNPYSQEPTKSESQISVKAQTRQSVNTETRIAAPIVRLTIDLPETDHTRFKTACAMTKRKMVDEVRSFIQRRTAELEGEAGRAQ